MNRKIEIRAVNWGEIVYNPHSALGPRQQKTLQLVIVHSGSAAVRVGDRWHRIDAGKTGLLFPGQDELFRFSGEERTHHSWIHFSLEEETREKWRQHAIPGILPTGSRVAFAIGELLDMGPEREAAEPGPSMALAELALYDVMDRLGLFRPDAPPLHPAVQQAVAFLEANYRKSLDLSVLSRISGISSQQLSRLFREQIGYTPMRYLWRLREEAGRRLLRETGLTVAEIAGQTGFANPYHFSRRIRQRYGFPPRALRLQDWGGKA